ncbi:MAG: AAA family ATPase [Sedimentisphaerales bacterium]|jgi:predicted ATP-dependent endonuclease of OLD family
MKNDAVKDVGEHKPDSIGTIKKIFIQNYKVFDKFELELNSDLNIIVGDNEVGKSTILEAINLALTKRLNGKPIEYEISPYLFNKKCANEYLMSLKDGKPIRLPEIIIELYLDNNPDLASLRGSNNTKKEDCAGVKIEIVFDEDYGEEYQNLIATSSRVQLIPAEYYKAQWYSFANRAITTRSLPIQLSYIDATTIRLQSGTDYYLQDIIKNDLDAKERVELNVAYRKLKELFSEESSIKGINDKLQSKKGAITNKDLSISIDISQKSNWETNLIPHLDDLPFQLIGKGEQNALKIMLALERKGVESNIILIEEPENHLSFSSMNILISKIKDRCVGKQIIIATHSTYVLNKLGLEHLILLHYDDRNKKIENATLRNLPKGTQDYFKKLSGYDTLRLVLAKKAILVEGPSDELVVQKAYLQKHHVLPIEKGIDVINARGISFSRFLDIAKELKKDVIVVTDNDGNYESRVDKKYKDYKNVSNIVICRPEDNTAPTLEPQLVNCNDSIVLNKVLGKTFPDKEQMINYMINNKTECALKIFETEDRVVFPDYIENAIK